MDNSGGLNLSILTEKSCARYYRTMRVNNLLVGMMRHFAGARRPRQGQSDKIIPLSPTPVRVIGHAPGAISLSTRGPEGVFAS